MGSYWRLRIGLFGALCQSRVQVVSVLALSRLRANAPCDLDCVGDVVVEELCRSAVEFGRVILPWLWFRIEDGLGHR